MRRALALLLLPGCTFAPGDGFTDVTAGALTAALDADTLESADGAVVTVSSAALSFDAVVLQALQGADSVDFDPANPPEGYTLCHGDHCHSTSGELISYDVIIAELSGGSASFEPVGELDGLADLDLLQPRTTPLSGRAELPLVDLSQVALPAPRLVLAGEAEDGTPVAVDLTLGETLLGDLLYDVSRTGPPEVRLDVDVLVPDTLLLGVDLGALADADGVRIDDPAREEGVSVGEALRTAVVDGALSPVE